MPTTGGVLRLHQASLFLMNRLSHLFDPASSSFFRQTSLLGRPGGTCRFSGLRLDSGLLDKLLQSVLGLFFVFCLGSAPFGPDDNNSIPGNALIVQVQ